MVRRWKKFIMVTLCAVWIGAVALGMSRLWHYESIAGENAEAPHDWPDDSRIVPARDVPTLLLLIHPHCPCSRATLEEFSKLMARCDGRLSATVIMIRPEGVPQDWEKTDLWRAAAAIGHVSVIADDNGVEATRFHAATSGQTLLYSADGRLLFAGGITESRGHSGDNAGRLTIESLVLADAPAKQTASTPVFGCPLFSKSCAREGR